MAQVSIQSNIPVTPVKASNRLHWQRRFSQLAFIALLILIPVTGLLRIDPIAGAFVVLDRQIWWSDFSLVFGAWLMVATGFVLLYSSVGTAFCGWACPQNSVSEWANYMMRRLLGKRAQLSMDGKPLQVAVAKDRVLNWLILSVSFLLVAMFFALIPLFYFYPPTLIWSFVTFRFDPALAPSLHFIYAVFVLVLLLDISVIRHYMCRFMCMYKVWQHGFKTTQTLHVAYDKSRADVCVRCNYCVTACFLDIDPRQTDVFDTCINCGECISACRNLQAKKGLPGLLSFHMGERPVGRFFRLRSRMGSLSTRVRWTLPFLLIAVVMFVAGLINYDAYHLAAYRADQEHGAQINDYRVRVSHKLYAPADVTIRVEGVDGRLIQLERSAYHFDGVGYVDIKLQVSQELGRGLHRFLVIAESADGWRATYPIHHFVG